MHTGIARGMEYYNPLTGSCELCPHHCHLAGGHSGLCGVRSVTSNGEPRLPFYGQISAIALDPIEKKPLRHFHPGSYILSAGFTGCNARCPFCQNWQISQDLCASTEYLSPEALVALAKKERSFAIAFTYSEPLIHYEYLIDTMALCRAEGIRTVLVSNGMICGAPARELFKLTDACNIDLKTWDTDSCQRYLNIDLTSVKESIAIALECGTHVELSTLIVPAFNDNLEGLLSIGTWIASLNREIPWHLAACHPAWKYHCEPTDANFVRMVQREALKMLRNVYTGNI